MRIKALLILLLIPLLLSVSLCLDNKNDNTNGNEIQSSFGIRIKNSSNLSINATIVILNTGGLIDYNITILIPIDDSIYEVFNITSGQYQYSIILENSWKIEDVVTITEGRISKEFLISNERFEELVTG